MQALLEQYYGHYLEQELLAEITQVGLLREIPAGFSLIDIGEMIQDMPLVLNGLIKIMREDPEGNELLLYFLERGDTCAVSLSCCLGRKKSQIRAVAEIPTQLITIPVQKMEEWTGKYPSWRGFVFDSYHERLMELFETVDSLAFLDMEGRLFKYLRDKARAIHNDQIQNTHQEIADDLHTSRVVISRLLKKLEKQGKIILNRNNIQLLDL